MAANVVIKFIGDDSKLKSTIKGINKGLGKVGLAAGAAVAAIASAAVAFAAFSLKTFASFEDKLNQSFAIMGDLTEDQKTRMSDAARDVAKSTRISADQAAESFFFLASAGFDAEQSIAAMPQVAAFAQAGMFDMALATDLATDAQSALGLKSADAAENLAGLTRVTDVLVTANTLANGSVEQFSSALTNKAGAALKILGKDMEEGVAVLAAFADQGVKGQIAGTQLGIVIRDLTTKEINKRKAFEDAGVAVFDATGKMNNMADIIGDLEGALGGLSDRAQKKMLLDMGFGDKSLASLMTLIGTSDSIREYEEALRDAGGTTQEVADKQLDSFAGQMDLLKSRFNDVAIEVGSRLAPLILAALDRLQAWWDTNGEAVKAQIKAVFNVISEWWDANGDTVIALALAVFDAIKAKINQVVEFVQSIWPQLEDIFTGVLEIITTAWEKWGEDITAFIEKAWEQIALIIEGVVTVIEGVVEVIQGILDGDWTKVWNGMKKIVKGAFKALKAWLTLYWERFKLMLKIVGDVILGLIKSPYNKAKDAIVGIWETIKTKVGDAKDAVVGKFTDLKDDALGALDDLVSGIGDKTTDFYNAAKGLGSEIINGIGDSLSATWSFAGDVASSVVGAIKNLVNTQVIDRINNLLEFKVNVPWGPDIHINPKDIPHLAKGGVTGVNDPFLAVVGDNTTSREIITPENLMRQIVREEGGGGGQGPAVIIENINMSNKVEASDISDEIMWSLRMAGV